MSTMKCKTLIVGDGAIGKTCLLSRLTNNAIDWSSGDVEYEPTTFNNFSLTWEEETEDGYSKTLEVELWDTAGQEGFEQLRTLSYPGTDVYLIGYSCNTKISLKNIELKWLPEINKTREENAEEGTPWTILVGTKKDMREEGIKEGKGAIFVATEQAKEVARNIDACALVETSAKTEDREESGVEELESMMMTLGFMKAQDEPKPSWGDFGGDEAPKAAKKAAEADAKPVPNNAAEKQAAEKAVVKTPETSTATATATDAGEQDGGCKCVIS